MWRRKLSEARKPIPNNFPLKSFYEYPTFSLDVLCYDKPFEQAKAFAEEKISEGLVVHVHPEWIFQSGKRINHRGPYYSVFKEILDVDNELNDVGFRKKVFFKIASYTDFKEDGFDLASSEQFKKKLVIRDIDLFSFAEHKESSGNSQNYPSYWTKEADNIALLHISSFDKWWNSVGKKTRNMVRKAEKSDIKTIAVEPNDDLAKGICNIYNETPIRQGRAFPHFGSTLKDAEIYVNSISNSTFIGAFFKEELAGFIQLVYHDDMAVIAQILSLQKYWDKAINNALVAKAVEICAEKKVQKLMYGRIGNHPSLDNFKENNKFVKYKITRYYVPLTLRGKVAIKLNLHKEVKDTLPGPLKKPLFPFFNWISRTKVKIRLKLHPKSI